MRPAALLLPLALTAIVAVPAFAGAAASSRAAVRLEHTQINPARVTIRRGGTVTWRFLDGTNNETHNVTSVGGRHFAGSGDRLNGTYSVRFTRSGTYRYECTIHFNMQGVVVVR